MTEEKINALAVAHWHLVWPKLADMYARALHSVRQINRENSTDVRMAVQLRIVNANTGAWVELGGGNNGHDLISLVQWLANDAPRAAAAAHLKDVLDSIGVMPKAA